MPEVECQVAVVVEVEVPARWLHKPVDRVVEASLVAEFRSQRDDEVSGGVHRVVVEFPPIRRAVNDNIVVVLTEKRVDKMLFEASRALHSVFERGFDTFQVRVGREQVEAASDVDNVVAGVGLIDEDRFGVVFAVVPGAVLVGVAMPEVECQVAVVVEVDEQRGFVTVRELACEVERGCRFPESAFQDAYAHCTRGFAGIALCHVGCLIQDNSR